jgi:hypothetical protein
MKWKLRGEFVNGRLGIESYFGRKGPNETATENSPRQSRDVIAFECLENGNRDLGGLRDLEQRDAAAFARVAKAGSQTARGQTTNHVRSMYVRNRP